MVMTLAAEEFIRRFLLHALPDGLKRGSTAAMSFIIGTRDSSKRAIFSNLGASRSHPFQNT
jgi:hypothetical protein